uniref:cyclin-A2 isoform X2 n=1 Tax=Myxine glutinosa TaxID=7769 RepID=UPI00358E8005
MLDPEEDRENAFRGPGPKRLEKGPARPRAPCGRRQALVSLPANLPPRLPAAAAVTKQASQCLTIVGASLGQQPKVCHTQRVAPPTCAVGPGEQRGFVIHVDEQDGSSSSGVVAAPDHVLAQRSKFPTAGCAAAPPSRSTVQDDASTGAERRESLNASADESMVDLSVESPMIFDEALNTTSEASDTPCSVDSVGLSEYAVDIYTYQREAEKRCLCRSDYMRKQPDITCMMRAILVDWLVEVAEEYKLQNETLYLSVGYIDRFLSTMSVLRGKLQLVGTAAMYLASKFEEIYPPEVSEFVYITDDTYTRHQVLSMEHLILKVLSFDVSAPTAHSFLLQYLHRIGAGARLRSVSLYLAELTLIDADPFLRYLPSMIAAAAYALASLNLNRDLWPETLTRFTSYTLEELRPCIIDLHRAHLAAPQHPQQAVPEKYKSSKYHGVSLLKPRETLPLDLANGS